MKKINLIIAMVLFPIVLSANNAKWLTNGINIYETPFVDAKRKGLAGYKKYDSYEIIACDNYGWCVSKDGYVKKYVLKLNDEVPIVKDLTTIQIEKTKIKYEEDTIIVVKPKEKNNILDLYSIQDGALHFISSDTNKTKVIKKIVVAQKSNIKQYNMIDLSIKNFIKEVIKRNPNMIFDRIQSEIIKNQVNYEKSIFTPQFYVNLTHQEANTPNNTEATLSKGYLTTYSETSNNGQMGFTGLFSSGAKWNTSIKMNDKSSSVIEKYKKYDTEYDNALEISLTQPLLKGFGSEITLSKYHLAKADKHIFDKQYQKKLMDMMGSVIQTYWKFYGAKQLQKSYLQSIKINQQAITLLKEKVKSGAISYSEVLEAQSAAMSRKSELKKINSEVLKIKNDILTMLNVSIKSNKNLDFRLVDMPNSKEATHLTLQQYYKKAILSWPEFAIAKEKLKKEEFSLTVTQNQIKPQLDLVATLTTATLDDERHYDFYEDQFRTWNVGIQYSIPLYDDQTKNVLNMAKLKKKQIELEIRTLDKGLYNAISTKLESLANSKDQVNFYEKGLKIKEELYGYVQKSFYFGEKSIKDVLEQEDDIIDYKRRLFGTIVDWKLAQASLDKATGSLFDRYLKFEDIQNFKDIKYDDKLKNTTFGKLNIK